MNEGGMNLFKMENIQQILLNQNNRHPRVSPSLFQSLRMEDQKQNLYLFNFIQQQANFQFQNLLKRYENYLAFVIESCLNSVRSADLAMQPELNVHYQNLSIPDVSNHQENFIVNQNESNNNSNSNGVVPSMSNCVDLNNVIPNKKRIDKKFKCDWPECNRGFQTQQILNHHRRFHIRKSNYQCKHCSVRLLSHKELITHISKCENNPKDGKYVDEIGSQSTSNEDKDGNNKSDNNNGPSFNIDISNQESNNHKSLIDQLVSPRNSKNRDLKKALLAIKTYSSNRTSSSSSNEQYKRTRYSGIGRYRCPWPGCAYTPHFLRDLRRHMFKHTGDKRYKCPQCRFVSVWKTSLLQHQRKKHNTIRK